MPMLRLTAPTWKLSAIWGRAVAMTVPSKFSMKKAPAMRVVTYSGERSLFMDLVYEKICQRTRWQFGSSPERRNHVRRVERPLEFDPPNNRNLGSVSAIREVNSPLKRTRSARSACVLVLAVALFLCHLSRLYYIRANPAAAAQPRLRCSQRQRKG